MATAQNIIDDAVQLLGVYAAGEATSTNDSNQMLTRLNDMMDEWAGEFLYVYELLAVTTSVVTGQTTYTIEGNSTNQARPPRVDYGLRAANMVVSNVTTPVNIVSPIEWRGIQSLSSQTATPHTMFYDPQWPQGIINITPTPNANGSLLFNVWSRLSSWATLSDAHTLANGYQDALKFNLAVYAKPYFTESALNPSIIAEATASKRAIKYLSIASRAMIGRTDVNIPRPQGAPNAASA